MPKRFKRVLLVQSPAPEGVNTIAQFPSPSLGIIAEILEQNEVAYDVLDLNLGYSFTDLVQKVKHFNPDLLGFSMMTPQYKKNYDLLTKIKLSYPNLKIAVGGVHVSSFKENVLKQCSTIDFGAVLEGEKTIIELCDGKQLEDIKGLLYKKNGKIYVNDDREYIINLDDIPFPRYRKFELNKYLTNVIGLITSRGCPYRCIYCCVKCTTGRKFRVRSIESVFAEISYFYSKGYRNFYFLDDNFTLIPDRVYQLCDLIEKEKYAELNLALPNGIRADKVDRKLLERMRSVGFYKLSFGVEAGNNKILKILKKGEKIETIENAIKLACDIGYEVTLYFLFGSPYETENDVNDSISLALKYPIHHVEFYNIVPFPNTELYEWLEKNEYFLARPEDYLNEYDYYSGNFYFETPELSKEKRLKMFHRLKKVRHKIFQQSIERKYMKSFGLAARPIARLVTSNLFLNLFYKNKLFRILTDKLRNNMAKAKRPFDSSG